MANTYESKFKGVEIDDGVNTATYATGTGGINVTIKGTTNVTGTGGRHLEIDGSGKQDKFTDDLIVRLDKPITGFESESIIGIYANNGRVVLEAPSNLGPTGVSYVLPAGYGTVPLASTESLPKIVQATGTATGSVMSQNAVTKALGKKQDTITDQTSLNVGGLKVTGTIQLSQKTGSSGAPLVVSSNNGDFIEAYNGISYTQIDMLDGYYTNTIFLPTGDGTLALTSDIPTGGGGGTTITADGVVKTAMNASSTGGTGVLLMTDEYGEVNCSTLHADVSAEYCDAYEYVAQTAEQKNYRTTLQPTGIYFEWTGGSYPDLDEGSNRTLTLCGPLSTSTTSARDNIIRLPAKSGTVALLSDITGGGSAGVSSIGGTTGAITLSTGLAMSGQQLVNKVKVYTSGNYLCIDTN